MLASIDLDRNRATHGGVAQGVIQEITNERCQTREIASHDDLIFSAHLEIDRLCSRNMCVVLMNIPNKRRDIDQTHVLAVIGIKARQGQNLFNESAHSFDVAL